MLFHTTRSIKVAAGAAKQLGDSLVHHVTSKNLSRSSAVVVVTDAGIIKSGLELPALASLKDEGFDVIVYDGVQANPPEQNIRDAVGLCRDVKAQAVIGLGGGSSMDVAKVTAFLAYPGQKQRLEDIYGVGNCKGPRLPLVQIPTTAGTGSEVTPISIVTTNTNEKKGIVSTQLLPDLAILDAELTIKLPKDITAMTGLDAMIHAIEASTSLIKKNQLSDIFAREALKLLGENISKVTGSESTNVQAREGMLLGSMYAGMAFANAPVGAIHALAYPLGTRFHVPHGLSICLVAPTVLRFNAMDSELARNVYTEAARILFPELGNLNHLSLADIFEKYSAGYSFPLKLKDVGVKEEDISKMAEEAMQQTRLLPNNPVPVTKEDCIALYKKMLA